MGDYVNKNKAAWDRTYFTVFNDPDLEMQLMIISDVIVRCNLPYSYNSDNQDGNGTGRTYGINPPAVGLSIVESPISKINTYDTIKTSSVNYFTGTGAAGSVCEQDPSSAVIQSYNYMRGVKRTELPINPTTTPPYITKFCYNGDPESTPDGQNIKARYKIAVAYNGYIGTFTAG